MQLGPNQTKFVEDLKTTTFPQCKNLMFADAHGEFLTSHKKSDIAACCALGRAFLVFEDIDLGDGYITVAQRLNTDYGKSLKIARLNDKENKSFAEIGAIIEANPEEFFNGPV